MLRLTWTDLTTTNRFRRIAAILLLGLPGAAWGVVEEPRITRLEIPLPMSYPLAQTVGLQSGVDRAANLARETEPSGAANGIRRWGGWTD
jgi:hypothetical protein